MAKQESCRRCKVKVNLNIASGKPGMDLAESTGGLVLVSGVAGHALNAGLPTGEYHCRCGSRGRRCVSKHVRLLFGR